LPCLTLTPSDCSLQSSWNVSWKTGYPRVYVGTISPLLSPSLRRRAARDWVQSRGQWFNHLGLPRETFNEGFRTVRFGVLLGGWTCRCVGRWAPVSPEEGKHGAPPSPLSLWVILFYPAVLSCTMLSWFCESFQWVTELEGVGWGVPLNLRSAWQKCLDLGDMQELRLMSKVRTVSWDWVLNLWALLTPVLSVRSDLSWKASGWCPRMMVRQLNSY
jgi:hypothetical protein